METEIEQTFWMVWCDGRRTPAKVHRTCRQAQVEAERICKQEKRRVYVLKAESVCFPKEPPVEWKIL